MTEEYLTPTQSLIQKCLGLVETLIAHGDSTQSIELIEVLLEAEPNHPQLHKKKAFALITQNRFEDALISLDACILYSENVEKSQCLVNKADLLYSLQKYAEALKIYDLLLNYNPNRSQIIYRKGLCNLACNKYKLASQLFEKVLSLNADYLQCYVMNSHSLFMQKKYKKALKCLDKITSKSDFSNIDALYLKACCFYNLKNYENCQKQLKNILQIDFSHIESKVLLSITKIKLQSIPKK